MDKYGTSFEWWHANEPDKKGFTAWSPMSNSTDYLGDALQQYMINYRVENREALVKELKKEGVTIVDDIEMYETESLFIYRMVRGTGCSCGKPMIRSMRRCWKRLPNDKREYGRISKQTSG